MNIVIDYVPEQQQAIIRTDEYKTAAWQSLCNIAIDDIPTTVVNAGVLQMPWHAFLAFMTSFATIATNMYKANISILEKAENQLRNINNKTYSKNCDNPPVDSLDVKLKLSNAGFIRELTDEQLRNVSKLVALPAGASFSVPGAGKTTEALAYFFYHATSNDKLLVVAPKNAFPAWDEQLICCSNINDTFVRLRGGEETIQGLLSLKPRFSIITYSQFVRIPHVFLEYLSKNIVFMYLDESHRIKRGGGATAEAILKTSFLPQRKLILSGTPMPQSTKDLNPQFSFLYPDVPIRNNEATELIQHIYVRTTKAELGLPQPIRRVKQLCLTTNQQLFYKLLKSEAERELFSISRIDRRNMRNLGKSIIKLMQFVSNPALLARDISNSFSSQLCELLATETSVKVEYACSRARELAKEHKKTIIWTSFVENVELIAFRLSDIGADFIHGGVDAGDEDIEDTREGKIKRFHQDPNAMVLVANPAAAAEGISLHTVCHHAIYVDRSFNAAQYLQSEDRIHRLGLPQHISTYIEILECQDTVDVIVTKRLTEKVKRMSQLLNDNSLNILADIDTLDDESLGMDDDDMVALIQYFRGEYHD